MMQQIAKKKKKKMDGKTVTKHFSLFLIGHIDKNREQLQFTL